MHVFAGERDRPLAHPRLCAIGVRRDKSGRPQLVSIWKRDGNGGVRKELQPASHDRLEHGLRVVRRTADQLENFRSRSLLLQRFVALAPRNIGVLGNGFAKTSGFWRTARFCCGLATGLTPLHCLTAPVGIVRIK